MYSFAQRADTAVLDEPLYANYLRLTGLPRPYREQVSLFTYFVCRLVQCACVYALGSGLQPQG